MQIRGLSVFRKLTISALLFTLSLAGHAFAEVIDGEELSDPTRPFLLREVDNSSVLDLVITVVPASYDLSFIRASSSSPMAVINQQRVTIGDVIGGAEVVAIDRSGVTLRINDKEKRISLYDVSIKANSVSQ